MSLVTKWEPCRRAEITGLQVIEEALVMFGIVF